MSEKEDRLDPSWLPLLLEYQPQSGCLFWLPRDADTHGALFPKSTEAAFRRFNTQFAGRQAFTAISAQGYHVGAIGVPFMAHRVVWAFVHGCWPTEQIDHINRIKTDNRIANLREASRRQNGKNRKPHKGGSSQFLGVHYIPDRGKWGAAIMADGTQIRVGTFDTEIEAAVARDRAAADMHGDFASLNFPEMGQPS